LIYITPSLVELNKLKKVTHAKSWLVTLATSNKIKVIDFIFDCELSIDGQSKKLNMNILPLGSYDLIIGMDCLGEHKVILNYYEKSFVYKCEKKTVRMVQGIRKIVSFRKMSAMQFKKCMKKGCQIYVVQVTNLLREERKPCLEYFTVLRGLKYVFVDEIK